MDSPYTFDLSVTVQGVDVHSPVIEEAIRRVVKDALMEALKTQCVGVTVRPR